MILTRTLRIVTYWSPKRFLFIYVLLVRVSVKMVENEGVDMTDSLRKKLLPKFRTMITVILHSPSTEHPVKNTAMTCFDFIS